MKKQNVLPDNVGRLTRARAAALRAYVKMPAKAPNQKEQRKNIRTSAKRAVLDENKTSAPGKDGVQCKRRAVLKDVTNVCCQSVYRSCFNATKIQVNYEKQNKKNQINASRVTHPVSVEPWHLQPNSKKTSVLKSLKEEPKRVDTVCTAMLEDEFFQSATSNDPLFIDIDNDHKDPQLCTHYAADIYNNWRVVELVRRPCSTYMETVQRDISQSMRAILVDWLVEVSEEYKLVPDTLYLTVYLIDWYLSQNYIERHGIQLLGITCMLIASKYEEICAPHVEEFCFITDNTYTRQEVLKMESHVLKFFGFHISAPTAKTFLRRFLRAAQASNKTSSYELEYLADYLAELTLVDYSFLNFLPSVIAASAVFLARWTLDQTSHPWNPTLVHYTSYKASDLKSTIFQLQDLQLNSNGCPLNAISRKYTQPKFKSVAALSSPKLLETLF